ncbi:STAND family AAA ATPase [Vagococcus teuberi]|uniref:Uncharacterized protein n=1 Tax=Vagococcus teuberi TaxID=519472 RepID=A0A1J0A851_9ENTE|nr:metallophosphoesterase [Vagococcus teuberi]APB32124.1 hypothetical protein BHY08_10065 [Vagococcus teuberi]
MKLGIINFSDIHLFDDNEKNSIMSKIDGIENAVKNRISFVDKILILVSGDTAFSGKNSEYEVAITFFMDLIDRIKTENKDIDFLFIPGNHDCHFIKKNENLRNTLIDGIDENVEIDDSIIDQIIVQNEYNEFKKIMYSYNENTEIILENKFYEKVNYNFTEEIKLSFHLFNTAWISKLREEPGTMFFPNQVFEILCKSFDSFINISVLHHPPHWCEPNNKRLFESRLQEISDVIITGHEHANNSGKKEDNFGETIFIEGCVLQESWNSDKSEFNYIEVDMEASLLKLEQLDFRIDKNAYYPNKKEYDLSTMKQHEIRVAGSPIYLNPEIIDFYEDLGAPIDHPDKGRLLLKDIYVYPDFSEVLTEEVENKVEDAKIVIEELEGSEKYIYIFQGDKEFGKTSLLKSVALRFYKNQIYPLYLDAGNVKQKEYKKVEKIIRDRIQEQYGEESYEDFFQLDKSKKVLLVDDWNLINLNKDGKNKLLLELCKYFDKVILSSQNTTMDIKDTLSLIDTQNREVKIFNLKKFGYKKRGQIVEKWLNLSHLYEIDEKEEYVFRFDEYIVSLNEIVGKNYIPQVPLYLLIILQSIDSGKKSVDFDKQTNGYYYELLIKQLIYDIQIGSDDISTLNNYLKHLAYHIFKSKKNTISYYEFKKLYEDFVDYYDLDEAQFRFEQNIKKLELANILQEKENNYYFKYKYVFYYFTAQYISENINSTWNNIHEKDTKEDVIYLIQNIHVDLYSNILIFLIHESIDEMVFEEVIKQSKQILPKENLMDIDGELNNLVEKLPELIINTKGNAMENRASLYESRDVTEEVLEGEMKKSHEEINELDVYKDPLIIEFEKAQKFTEVIGQILKNYGGIINKRTKESLLTSSYRVSLKAGNILSELVINEKEDLIKFVINELEKLNSDELISKKDLENRAGKMVFEFVGLIYSSIIQKAIVDTGTNRMKSTYDKYLKEEENTAIKLILVGSLLENTRLDQSEKVIENLYEENSSNYMVKNILRHMVGRHLYMFDIPYSKRQQICKTYDIIYDPSLNKTRLLK